MKIAIFTDLHIADRGSQMKGSKQRLSYVEDFIEWFCQEVRKSEVDLIINCGDLTSSDNLSATEITALSNTIGKLESLGKEKGIGISVRHVLGNHERKDKEGIYSSLNFLDTVDRHGDYTNDKVNGLVREFMVMHYGDTKLVFAPYGTEDQLRDLETEPGYNYYAFTHLDFYDGMSKVTGLNPAEFQQYNRIFNGHVHNASEFDNIVNIGSCLGSNFSDNYSTARPGIIILDTDTGEYKRIENPTSPLYFTISSVDYLELPTTVVDRCYIRIDSPDVIKELKESNDLDVLKIYANVSIPSVIESSHDDDLSFEVTDLASLFKHLSEFYKGDKEKLKLIIDISKTI